MVPTMASSKDVLLFGPFRLVPAERLLTRDGASVELGARALDILIALVSRPNDVISKKEHKGAGQVEVSCLFCDDEGWVCESHPDQPFAGPHACRCGAAGMPCQKCNPSSLDEPPRLPKGFELIRD